MDSNNNNNNPLSKDPSIESVDLVDEDDDDVDDEIMEPQHQGANSSIDNDNDEKMVVHQGVATGVSAAANVVILNVDDDDDETETTEDDDDRKPAAAVVVAAYAAAAGSAADDAIEVDDDDDDVDDSLNDYYDESLSDYDDDTATDNNDDDRKRKAFGPPAATSEEVIDLCDDDDDDDNDVKMGADYSKMVKESINNNNNMVQQGGSRKRPAVAAAAAPAPSASVAAAAPVAAAAAAVQSSSSGGPDAIEIDFDSKNPAAAAKSAFEQATAEYRKVLGPIRMDFVDNFKGKHAHADLPGAPIDIKYIYKELIEYKLNLPIELSSSIFVRVLQSRLALMRALITGPEDTPYANGCFLFDVFAGNYPQSAPKVKFLTTGQGRVRFNPNLYQCGKVCLSLLGTWSGPGWEPNKSTLLQVLVSIQGLILVPDPFFNEPGYAESQKSVYGQAESRKYSLNIRRYTLEHAMDAFLQQAIRSGAGSDGATLRDYPEFTSIIVHHFLQRATAIEKQLDDWIRDDAAIANLANRVRSNLQTLVRMHASLADVANHQHLPAHHPPPFAAAAGAKKPPPEMIDLS